MVKRDKTLRTINHFSYFNSTLSKDDIKIKYSTYLHILKRIMEFKVIQLFYSGMIGFPFNRLYLYNYEIDYSPEIVDGKLKYNGPPNWKATKELWAMDPIAKQLKKVVKADPCTKYTCKFFVVHPNRSLRECSNTRTQREIRKSMNEQARKGNPPIAYRKAGTKYKKEKQITNED